MAGGRRVTDLKMNEERYLSLLEKLIGETEFLQNNPIEGLVPQEDRACKHVIDALEPYLQENGGPLLVEHVSFVQGRGNIIITYPGTSERTIGLAGSHLDVVPADPEQWDFDPFQLTRDGDRLCGRGTTDCLGHVALVTEIFCLLSESRPTLEHSVVGVFIADEESLGLGIGVDALEQQGKLDCLKNGPVVWIDSADSKQCIGTCSVLAWHLRAEGKAFHSGLPHRGINSIELVQEATRYLQDRFFKEFPAHPEEKRYKFELPSSMKPTQMECVRGTMNLIPQWAQCSGDIRLTPFYEAAEVEAAIQKWVAELNEDLTVLPTRGNHSKFVLPDGTKGHLTFTMVEDYVEGIACNLESPGHKALLRATETVRGKERSDMFSVGGSLPLVRTMQRAGFDVQITGYGLSSAYHANNEYALLSDLQDGARVLLTMIDVLETGSVTPATASVPAEVITPKAKLSSRISSRLLRIFRRNG